MMEHLDLNPNDRPTDVSFDRRDRVPWCLDMNQVANDVNSRGNVGLSHNIFNISWSPILCVHCTFYILLPNGSKILQTWNQEGHQFPAGPKLGRQLEVAMPVQMSLYAGTTWNKLGHIVPDIADQASTNLRNKPCCNLKWHNQTCIPSLSIFQNGQHRTTDIAK